MDMSSPISSKIVADKISFWVLIVSLFLVPLFFIPSSFIPVQFSKVFILFISVIIASIVWIIARLKEGKLTIPTHRVFWLFVAIPLWFIISGIFSGSRTVSLIGHGFEIGTASSIVVLFLLMFLISVLFRSVRALVYAYLTFLVVFVILVLFHIFYIFDPSFLNTTFFGYASSSLLGNWDNNVGIFFGSTALFAFLTLEFLKIDRWLKWGFVTVLLLSLFLVSIISFSAIWYVLAASSVVFFIYNFSFKKSIERSEIDGEAVPSARRLPLISLVVFIISIVFILLHGNLYSILGNSPFNIPVFRALAIPNAEAWPSLGSTYHIALDSIKTNPIFGVGPNRFSNEWRLVRPVDVNNTVLWNTDFNYAVGIIPTYLITTGIIGFLLWIVFLLTFLWFGFKAMFLKKKDPFKEYLIVSTFIISLYFWIFSFIYVPSPALVFLTFFFTGLFFASLYETGLIKDTTFDFARDPRTSFTSVLLFVILLLIALVSVYEVVRHFTSAYYYNEGVAAANVGSMPQAANSVVRAITFSPDDQYYDTLAEIAISQANSLIANPPAGVSQDVLQSQLRTYVGNAQSSANAAIGFDKTNYANWITLGDSYAFLVPLNVSGAYEVAKNDYAQAEKLDPEDPSIYLTLAQLDVAHGDDVAAKNDIAQALTLKNDYTDAIFFLAQIQLKENDTASAIKSLEASTLVAPNNAGTYFQLGLLNYNIQDYKGAASAFSQAVNLIPNYANAEYFFGLSLSKLGDNADAIIQFQNLAATNPGNQQIASILSNLQAGRDPLSGFTPPANQPQKQTKPPLTDSTSSTNTKTPAKQ